MRPEEMRVYQTAIELCDEVDIILAELAGQGGNAAIHLEKSADSAFFNLSEGLIAFKPKVKASKFDISREEVAEVKAALTRLTNGRKVKQGRVAKARALANSLTAILTKMIKQQEDRDD